MGRKRRFSDVKLYRSMIVTTILTVVVFFIFMLFAGQRIRDNNHEYLVNDTQRVAGNIEYILSSGYDNIKVLGELVSQSAASAEINISDYQRFIHDSVFDFVEFADINGLNHNVTGGISDASDREYFLNAMAGQSGMEIIYNSRATHENLLLFYSPVYFEGTIIGSLIGSYEATNKLTGFLDTKYFGEKSTMYLCDENGRVFAGSEAVDPTEEVYISEYLKVSPEDMDSIKAGINEKTVTMFFTDGRRASGYIMPIYDGKWFLVQIFPTKVNVRMMGEMFLLAFLLVVAIFVIFISHQRIVYYFNESQENRISDQLSLIKSVTEIYYSIHLIDMSDFSIEEYEANELMRDVIRTGNNATDMLKRVVYSAVEKDYIDETLVFTDVTTLARRLKGKKSIFMDAVDKNLGWIRMSFITREIDGDGNPTKVILTTQIIDEDKRKEKELLFKANNDELTGLLNRRAYEEDLSNYPPVPPQADFVYVAIDINGLKVVNDNVGHEAGDELIEGAAKCMKNTIGNFGRVYRVGGDEFVAMILASDQLLPDIINDLRYTAERWKGKLVDELSLAVGFASKYEFESATIEEMAQIADKRMYEDKARHYSKKGVDRRGQAAAHTALCNLYTKILKINITTDSYSIVNMDIDEQKAELGFSEKISEWLAGFGKSGQVHEDDLKEYLEKTSIDYLSQYFKANKNSITIHYRRKNGDSFNQVVMEMIPADDYSEDNQSLFLYVKTI